MLLAVDTSTAQVGLAVYDGAQVIGEYAWRSRQRHTVELAPAIHELLTRCGLTMDELRALGVVVWPMIEFEADDALAAAAFKAAADPRVDRVIICTPGPGSMSIASVKFDAR